MNRLFLILIIVITWAHSVKGQKQMITINLKDFGAIPNDTISDQEAFEKVSAFINKRGGNCKLIIPKGSYIVGRQILRRDDSYYYEGGITLFLNNVENVIIEGNNAVLKYGLGYRFGAFDPKTGLSTNYTWECEFKPFKSSERAEIGYCIQLYQSENIQIHNLTLDGNFYSDNLNNMNSFDLRNVVNHNSKYMPEKINLGGGYGDCGLQVAHYGVFIFHSGNVKLKNIIAKRFGTDGLMITNTVKNKNIEVMNSVFDYNARTGIAIGGGYNIVFTKCIISNTAQCLYIATATGVNIEPEVDALTSDKTATNITFNSCDFIDNSEGNVLAKYGFQSSNVTFNRCTIKGGRAAIILGGNARNYKFINSRIEGKVTLQDKEIDLKKLGTLNGVSSERVQFIGIKY